MESARAEEDARASCGCCTMMRLALNYCPCTSGWGAHVRNGNGCRCVGVGVGGGVGGESPQLTKLLRMVEVVVGEGGRQGGREGAREYFFKCKVIREE